MSSNTAKNLPTFPDLPSVKVLSNRHLTPNADKSIYWLEFESDIPLEYEPGDWLLVKGHNRFELVHQVLTALNLEPDTPVELPRIGILPAGKALTEHLEITQLNPAILNKLQRQFQIGTHLWQDRSQMMAYAQGKDIFDLLQNHPEVKALGLEFLRLLSPLAPRFYSIASSAKNTAHRLSILFRKVEYFANGRMRLGVASNYLASLPAGEKVQIELRKNRTFKLPSSAHTPILMIASGTGLAPFIGFIEQRIAQGYGEQDNWLVFGETHPQTTCLLCENLQRWQQQQRLKIDFAFSRVAPKAYVQDRLAENREQIWKKWQQGTVVYLCGSQQKMAKDVQRFWQALFVEKLGLSAAEAEDYWQQMRKAKRIQLDVY